MPLSWTRSMQFMFPHPTSLKSILISSSHLNLGLPKWSLSPWSPYQNTLCTFTVPLRTTCPLISFLLDLVAWKNSIWSTDHPLSTGGHYMYRRVVTICAVQWSLYVPYNGQYMYRTVVTVCTVQWLLYVPYGGHYMYRTVFNICTVQWLLYIPQSLTFTILRPAHRVYLCLLNLSENKQRLFPYTALTDWFL